MEATDYNSSVRIVTLGDLWGIFVKRLWIIVLVAVLAVGVVFAAVQLTYTPAYSSTATLYILRQDDDASSSSTSSDFSLALNVVNDCTYLLKSHAVVDEVISALGLDMSYDDLTEMISASNPDDTRILEVTVEASTPKQAKEIVDTLCEIGQEKITEAMGFQQVNFYEKGTLEEEPCNVVSLTTYAMIGIIAAVLCYSAFLIAFLLDDRIGTEEDIQRYLGLSLLGEIPNTRQAEKKGYGHYGSYGYGRGRSKAKEAEDEHGKH
ncbi:MAG: Wzz/FepE/Etk N-terminal domain-containing protein [Clostridiales bacterium]|nr:Wzz/FepE/Etk N-terminal domain-containing protein [Clostridiales bacterium]